MMFTLIFSFHWIAMDGHSKREVLEIFNMNKKNVFAPRHQFDNYLEFLAKCSRDI